MEHCCSECKYCAKLVKFDYSQGGCVHTDYDGYACWVFAASGEEEIVHMVGIDPNIGMCEVFTPKPTKSNKLNNERM